MKLSKQLLFFIFFCLPEKNIYSMELLSRPLDRSSMHSFVEKFPSFTMKEAHESYYQYDQPTRNKIDKNFDDRKNELLSVVFHIASKTPIDLQKPIIQYLFDKNKEYQKQAVKMFFSLPIRDAYTLYAWSRKVFNGKVAIASSLKMQSLNHIFHLSHEIKQVKKIIKNNMKACLGKEDIRALQKIAESIPNGLQAFNNLQLKYRYHHKYSFDNLLDNLLATGMITGALFISLMTMHSSFLIEKYLCSKTIDRSVEHKIMLIKNITRLIQENGNMELMEVVNKIEYYKAYPDLDIFKMQMPFLAIGLIPNICEYISKKSISGETLVISGLVGLLLLAITNTCITDNPDVSSECFLVCYASILFGVFSILLFSDYIQRCQYKIDMLNFHKINQILADKTITIPDKTYQYS